MRSPKSEYGSRDGARRRTMPGLWLTPEQTGRLCGVERALCQSVLDALVVEKFLCVTSDGRYARVSDDVRGPRPAKAALRTRQHSLKAS